MSTKQEVEFGLTSGTARNHNRTFFWIGISFLGHAIVQCMYIVYTYDGYGHGYFVKYFHNIVFAIYLINQ